MTRDARLAAPAEAVRVGFDEWFELARKMFDFTGDNVFVIGTVGEAPAVLLPNNDLRNVPTEFPVSNTDWKGKPDVLGRPTLVRPLKHRNRQG